MIEKKMRFFVENAKKDTKKGTWGVIYKINRIYNVAISNAGYCVGAMSNVDY